MSAAAKPRHIVTHPENGDPQEYTLPREFTGRLPALILAPDPENCWSECALCGADHAAMDLWVRRELFSERSRTYDKLFFGVCGMCATLPEQRLRRFLRKYAARQMRNIAADVIEFVGQDEPERRDDAYLQYALISLGQLISIHRDPNASIRHLVEVLRPQEPVAAEGGAT